MLDRIRSDLLIGISLPFLLFKAIIIPLLTQRPLNLKITRQSQGGASLCFFPDSPYGRIMCHMSLNAVLDDPVTAYPSFYLQSAPALHIFYVITHVTKLWTWAGNWAESAESIKIGSCNEYCIKLLLGWVGDWRSWHNLWSNASPASTPNFQAHVHISMYL
jgi:hypothetical protein